MPADSSNNSWYTPGYRSLVIVLLALTLATGGCRPLYIVGTANTQLDTSQPPGVDSAIVEIIDPYREQLESQMDVVVAVLEADLVKEQPEGTLGNHVAAITYWAAERQSAVPVDFAVMNYGGLRVPYVNAGDLMVRDAYQIMPFDNMIVLMDLPGRTIEEMVNLMARAGGWPVEQMTYTIEAGEITIGGRPLDPEKVYRMAISDYLADGGDNLAMLKEYSYINTSVLLRDAIIDYWKWMTAKGEKISVKKDGRVSAR